MLFSGCWAVSVEPPVWVWKRSSLLTSFLAPKRSVMMRVPDATRGAELGDLLEEVVVGVPEEAEPGCEVVDVEAGVDRGLDVGDAVGDA